MAVPSVTVDAIDLVLREAKVCNAQLNCIHFLLNDNANTGENEEWRRRMEANTAMIFRDMVSYLYSVLDHIFYFLYCHFQNNGRASFTDAAINTIKQPITFTLKYCPNPGDPEYTFKKNRNNWVEDRCKEIFGAQYYQNNNLNSRLAALRNFQNNLLSIQAFKEVDKAGKPELSANGGVKLVSACNIQHQEPQAGPDHPGEVDLRFNPTSIDFQTLPSVQNIDSWNFALIFNLLHFFRNFTTHRTLIESRTKPGYLNLQTFDLKPIEDDQEGQLDAAEWKYIAKGSWIKVPELSHLRQNNRNAPVTFHWHPVVLVSSKLCWFVRTFRNNILGIVEGVQRYDVDDMNWSGSGPAPQIALKKDGRVVGIYAWDSARLHVAD